jgi:hypothetical protein
LGIIGLKNFVADLKFQIRKGEIKKVDENKQGNKDEDRVEEDCIGKISLV